MSMDKHTGKVEDLFFQLSFFLGADLGHLVSPLQRKIEKGLSSFRTFQLFECIRMHAAPARHIAQHFLLYFTFHDAEGTRAS